MNFTVEIHRTIDGKYTGQVLLAGRVVFEDEGNVSESQARANAEDGFALWLRYAIQRAQEYEMSDSE